MSVNVILVIVGAVLILVGLAEAGQSGGLSLSNIAINFGSTLRPTRLATLRRSRPRAVRGTGLGWALRQLVW
jgi:hypothetical protein